MKLSHRAFSLVEMAIIVAIICILAAIIIQRFANRKPISVQKPAGQQLTKEMTPQTVHQPTVSQEPFPQEFPPKVSLLPSTDAETRKLVFRNDFAENMPYRVLEVRISMSPDTPTVAAIAQADGEVFPTNDPTVTGLPPGTFFAFVAPPSLQGTKPDTFSLLDKRIMDRYRAEYANDRNRGLIMP